MAPSGGRPSAPQNDRRVLGLFSLALGLVLFLLIVVRGQQAAKEGNPELRNDSYWVLVSPAVFSIVGVMLLRTPRRSAGRKSPLRYGGRAGGQGAVDQARQGIQRATSKEQGARELVMAADRDAERQLTRARAEATAARAAAEASQRELEQAMAQAAQSLAALEDQLRQSEQQRREAEATLQRVLAGPATGPDDVPATAPDAVLVAAQASQRRAEELLGTYGAQLQEVRTLLEALRSGQQGELVELRRQAKAALEAAQAASRDAEALAEHQGSQLAQAREILERCTALEGGELAELRRQAADVLAVASSASTRLATVEQEIQQAQQARMAVEQDIAQALRGAAQTRGEVLARTEASERRLEAIESGVIEQLHRARQEADSALEATQEARQLVDRLEQVVFAQPLQPSAAAEGLMPPGGGAQTLEASAYREACEELGVLPGSSWQQVRATWRRNLMRWHPDQGGDPGLWPRRQTAYQLLEAWYAFNAST
ncbi:MULTISPECIES: hypothetical protein [Aphanothece]|uniref:hypothetical protein n=1 Tax=Aphanothece TaxID=1121 RepID=UPI00398520A5